MKNYKTFIFTLLILLHIPGCLKAHASDSAAITAASNTQRLKVIEKRSAANIRALGTILEVVRAIKEDVEELKNEL